MSNNCETLHYSVNNLEQINLRVEKSGLNSGLNLNIASKIGINLISIAFY